MNPSDSFSHWILGHRAWVALGLVILTLLAAAGIYDPIRAVPRIRIDQVLYACVQVLLPLTMLLLLGNTLWELAVAISPTFAGVSTVSGWLTGVIGLVLCGGFVAIMIYGRVHRWRLVGSLGVKGLPGS